MIKIEKTGGIESGYRQCTSCLKCNEVADIFKIIIGKTMQQTTTIKLCEECMRDLLDDLRDLEINGQI